MKIINFLWPWEAGRGLQGHTREAETGYPAGLILIANKMKLVIVFLFEKNTENAF